MTKAILVTTRTLSDIRAIDHRGNELVGTVKRVVSLRSVIVDIVACKVVLLKHSFAPRTIIILIAELEAVTVN